MSALAAVWVGSRRSSARCWHRICRACGSRRILHHDHDFLRLRPATNVARRWFVRARSSDTFSESTTQQPRFPAAVRTPRCSANPAACCQQACWGRQLGPAPPLLAADCARAHAMCSASAAAVPAPPPPAAGSSAPASTMADTAVQLPGPPPEGPACGTKPEQAAAAAAAAAAPAGVEEFDDEEIDMVGVAGRVRPPDEVRGGGCVRALRACTHVPRCCAPLWPHVCARPQR